MQRLKSGVREREGERERKIGVREREGENCAEVCRAKTLHFSETERAGGDRESPGMSSFCLLSPSCEV